MTFDLADLTVLATIIFSVAAIAAVVAVGALTSFFAQNRTTRVRRHEGLAQYYGNLVLGH